MTTQVAVRLPEELVAFMDEAVRSGEAASRAEVIRRSLEHERRRLRRQRDVRILQSGGQDAEADAVLRSVAAEFPDDLG